MPTQDIMLPSRDGSLWHPTFVQPEPSSPTIDIQSDTKPAATIAITSTNVYEI